MVQYRCNVKFCKTKPISNSKESAVRHFDQKHSLAESVYWGTCCGDKEKCPRGKGIGAHTIHEKFGHLKKRQYVVPIDEPHGGGGAGSSGTGGQSKSTTKKVVEGLAKPLTHENTTRRGLVKQVLSGDSLVLFQRPSPLGRPFIELTVYLAHVNAPRMAKRPTENTNATNDEPYAWESREFIRKKIAGKEIIFVREFVATSGREHGFVYLAGMGNTSIENAENITESGISAGLLEVKPAGKQMDDSVKKLLDLQEQAKLAKKGRWSDDEPNKHIRDIKWVIDYPRAIVDKYSGKEIDAIVEEVRDGSTIQAFLLPSVSNLTSENRIYEYVTIALSGIKTPSVRVGTEGKHEDYGEEAKFSTEIWLLQLDVKVCLEGVSNQNILASVLHPRGNIAEFLLKEGLAKCDDSTMGLVTSDSGKLRVAERFAKESYIRLWKKFTAKVIEIGLVDSFVVLKENEEELKIYLSSLRPPRREGTEGAARQTRPLYDIPFMFEAREFLRKRLIDKHVNIVVDYIQPKQEQYPEKTCCTVLFNNQNVAQMLIEKGFAKVIRHRQDDDNRSPQYNQLIAAETKAESKKKRIWAHKSSDQYVLRVIELQGDAQRSKQFLSRLQRSKRINAIVEFVANASRLRVYVPKESCLITFVLSGINAPRTARIGPNGKQIGANEPFSEDSMKFAKYKCLQKEVQIEVENVDKAGSFIGYMFVPTENGMKNMSEMLVENGLATVRFTADRSAYFNQLQSAQKRAKMSKINIWKDYVEEECAEEDRMKQVSDTTERKLNYKKILVTEIYPGFRFVAQSFEDESSIKKMMNSLQVKMKGQPSMPFIPKRQQLCAAKYTNGDLWHRARVDEIKSDEVEVYYVDFGNREILQINRLAPLPDQFQSQPYYAKEYQLALITNPPDESYARNAQLFFQKIASSKAHLYINVEYKIGNIESVTLYEDDESEHKKDVNKQIIAQGYALVEKRQEARLQPLLNEYMEAEQSARIAH